FNKVTIYRQPSEANGQRLYALTEAIDGGKAFDVTVIDEAGNIYITLQGYETVSLPG
ncbi:MAG: hypothetical protein HC802_21925, partial [Caldilineaceae bacterium]|nr:hypothetical protein [Caldilineaceae bacterium]